MSYFSFHELTKSSVSKENYPWKMEHVSNLVTLCDFLDDLREEFGEPIVINSAFRTPVVNKAVGGAAASLHMQGRAADIRPEYDKGYEYRSELLRLWKLLKEREEDLSELIIYDNFIHVAI